MSQNPLRIAVYRRVSTDDQTTASQAAEIDQWLAKNHPNAEISIYDDEGISGAKKSRPALDRLRSDCELGEVDMVVVYKLDRLTRSGAGEAVKIVHRFDELGIKFVSVTQPMFSEGSAFRVPMIAIFGELAEMERQNIIDRVNAGISAAKKRGVKFGAPKKYGQDELIKVLQMRQDGLSIRKIAEETGINRGAVHRMLTKAS